MRNLCLTTFLLLGLCLTACAHVPKNQLLAENHNPKQLTELLAKDIRKLSDSIDPQEAQTLAASAIGNTYRLARMYDMASPPEYHNTLVNMGLRERGLCWHWATDLLEAFFALNLQTIDFMWAEAHAGSTFSEHNVLVIAPRKNKVFREGLIFDPWRTAGKPYWVLLKDDTKYPWVEYFPPHWNVD